jgi:hypothetical protein
MIREASAEKDNLIVYYHSEALLQLESRLHVLYIFKDPLYQRREELRRRIDTMEKWPLSKYSKTLRPFAKKRNKQRVTELQDELQKLMLQPPATINETQIIDEALFALYEKRYEWFKLLVNYEENFGLHFKLNNNLLVITLIGPIWNEEPDFVFDNRTSNILKGLGFRLDIENNRHFHIVDITRFKDANPIKQWLSRFFIDYCRIYGSAQNIHLAYKES